MARHKPTTTDLTSQSVALSVFGAKALVAAEQLHVKKKPIQDFPLAEAGRAIAADLPGLSATLKKKLKTKTGTFTVADTASLVMALAEDRSYPCHDQRWRRRRRIRPCSGFGPLRVFSIGRSG